jgi:hypothetical protein
MRDIALCRTPGLGGHEEMCDACGHVETSWNSCGNRHCPQCQAVAQGIWIEKRKERILPTHHFHVVFTLPGPLRPLALRHPKEVYDLLFRAASATLLTIARDDGHLGATPAVTAVLHTWTRELLLHPHLHVVVSGGGLSPDGRWIATGQDFLFPVRVLSRLFRGKFLDGLRRLLRDEKIQPAPGTDLGPVIDDLYRTEWVVYSEAPFSSAGHLFEYLGRYTHRVAISNERILAVDDDGVRFRTRDGQTITLPPLEFLRRFLLHVLPKGFVKIRHYGLLAAGNATTQLERARTLLQPGASPEMPAPRGSGALDWLTHLLQLTGVDLTLCPQCSQGRMIRQPLRPLPCRPRGDRGPPRLGSVP